MTNFSVLVFLWFGHCWLITSLEFFYWSKLTMSSKHFFQLLFNSFISFAFITSVLPLRLFGTVYLLLSGDCHWPQMSPKSKFEVMHYSSFINQHQRPQRDENISWWYSTICHSCQTQSGCRFGAHLEWNFDPLVWPQFLDFLMRMTS